MTIEQRIEDYKRWTIEDVGHRKTTSPHYVLSLSFENEYNNYEEVKKLCQTKFGIKNTLFEVDNPDDFLVIKNSIEGMDDFDELFRRKGKRQCIDGGFLQSGL